jgi:hypothetical protein
MGKLNSFFTRENSIKQSFWVSGVISRINWWLMAEWVG